jgi:hypothetical protein
MRPYLLLLLMKCLCWLPIVAMGQNFGSVVADSVHYFKSEVGTLVGLRVDSMAQTNGHTEYYFHREFRWRHNSFSSNCDTAEFGEYEAPVDMYGPSWMGFKCVVLADGSEVYFNHLGDSIHIVPNAAVGQTYTVFTQSDGNSIKAQVTNEYTDVVSGQLQMVKVLQLQHSDQNGMPISGAWNGVQWKLSQYHGWIQVHSLYMFPQFEQTIYTPSYAAWNDFKDLEMVDTTVFFFHEEPVPTMGDMYDYSAGAHYQTTSSSFFNNGGIFEENTSYTNYYITGRQDYPDSIVYAIDDAHWTLRNRQKHFPNGFLPFQYYTGSSLESVGQQEWRPLIVGQPVQEGFYSSAYITDCELIGWSMVALNVQGFPFNGGAACALPLDCPPALLAVFNHFVGIYYNEGCFESSFSHFVNYAENQWCSFGTLHYIGITELDDDPLVVYPNPATNTVHILLPDNTLKPTGVRIYDLIGHLVHQQSFNPAVDVSTLPTGNYILEVTGPNDSFRTLLIKQ